MWVIFWIFLTILFFVFYCVIIKTDNVKERLETIFIGVVSTLPTILLWAVCASSINFDRIEYKYKHNKNNFELIDSGYKIVIHNNTVDSLYYLKYKEKNIPLLWKYVLPNSSFIKTKTTSK